MTNILTFAIVLLTMGLLQQTVSTHSCNHDTDESMKEFYHKFKQDFEEKQKKQRFLGSEESRKLAGTPFPIRITLDTSALNVGVITGAEKTYLLGLMDTVKFFVQDFIKVVPIVGNNMFTSVSPCLGDVPVPANDISVGVANSDLHIYVIYNSAAGQVYSANAGWCNMYSAPGISRPSFGRVAFNLPNMFPNPATIGTIKRQFQIDVNAVLHEVIHILGFSSSSMPYWINSATGATYPAGTMTSVQNLRGLSTTLLMTPQVLLTAQKYYNCASLTGMQLENQGGAGSYGSHWERAILQSEVMTASGLQEGQQLTYFTSALLKDTGFWDEVNENLTNPIYWGKSQGCNFPQFACTNVGAYPEFTTSGANGCTFYNDGQGFATTDTYSDNCYFMKSFTNFLCEDSSMTTDPANAQRSVTLDDFNSNSKCLVSSVINPANPGTTTPRTTRCLQYQCNASYSQITITTSYLPTFSLVCNSSQMGLSLPAIYNGNSIGNITCPGDYNRFCDSQICLNYCSFQGICVRGMCHCNPGQTGADCSLPCATYQEGGVCVGACTGTKWANPDNVCRSTCPNGYFKNGGVCSQCDFSCGTCSGALPNQCQSCQFLTYLHTNTCVYNCPVGTFADQPTKTCVACPAGCIDCTSLVMCGSCYAGYTKSGNICANNTCNANCLTCTGLANQCTSCYNGQYLNYSTITCVGSGSCPAGSYPNSNNNTCSSCPAGCADCTSLTVCGNCLGGYTKTGNICANNNCNINCSGCAGLANQCTSCANGLYLNYQNWTCVVFSQCPVGSYGNSGNNTCTLCLPGCADCTSGSVCGNCLGGYTKSGNICANNICSSNCLTCSGLGSQCTSCFNGLYLNYNNWTCVLSTQCPAGTFPNTGNNTCSSCPAGCSNCTTGSLCSSCNGGYTLSGNICANNTCNANCWTCTGLANQCTSCVNGLYLNYSNWTCVSAGSCPVGTYAYSGNNTCTGCPNGCSSCTSSISCGGCSGGFTLSGNLCANNACTGGCLSCTGISSQCTSCNTGQYLISSSWSCVLSTSCPVGSFANSSNNTCTTCPSGCADCTSSTVCGNCLAGFNKQGNICANNNCNTNCFSCSGVSNQCTSCVNGLFLNQSNQTCVVASQCPVGSFADSTNDTCTLCPTGCTNCTSLVTCGNCNGGYTMSGTLCAGNTCTGNCLTCTGASNQCTSCNTGQYLNSANSTCVNSGSCPGNTFANSYNNTCTLCPTGCADCTSSTVCGNCLGGYSKQSNICAINTCNSNCWTCNGIANQCTSCISGLYLNPINLTCVVASSCPVGTYVNSSNNTCNLCPYGCTNCTSSASCGNCVSGYTMSGNLCANNFCSGNCLSCTNTANQCTSCNNGLYFNSSNWTCVLSTSCPVGTYPNQGNNTCTSCPAGCSNCTSGSACGNCNGGYTLSGGICANNTCNSNCWTCTGLANQCTSCINGLYLNYQNWTCVGAGSCPVGSYVNSNNNTCTVCPNGCANCTSSVSCGGCVGGYTMSGNMCSNNFCTGNCLSCTGTSSQCTSCNNGLYLISSSWSCVISSQCPVGTYANSGNNTCTSCPVGCSNCTSGSACGNCNGGYTLSGGICANNTCNGNCLTCTGLANQCTSCNNGLYLNYQNWTCVLPGACPVGTYVNSNNNTCAICPSGCSSCTNPTTCGNCVGGYTLSGSLCANNACTGNCLSCTGISSQCTSCNNGLYLASSTWSCVLFTSCPVGTYGNSSNNTCTSCPTGCADCTSSTVCGNCIGGYTKSGNLCTTTNGNGCNSNCLQCTSITTQCSSCANGLYLNSVTWTCVSAGSCPVGTYPNTSNNTCTFCPPGCADCTSSTVCGNCLNNYTKSGNLCNGGNTACTNCLTCTNFPNSNQCTSCNNGFYFTSQNLSCGSTCFNGYYPNSINNSCTHCPFGCQDCTSATVCGNCVAGFIKSGNLCVGVGSQACGSNCLTCNSVGSNQCTSCNNGLYLVTSNMTCSATCWGGYYANTSNNTCTQCPGGCADCTSSNVCGNCLAGFTKTGNLCGGGNVCSGNCWTCNGSNQCTSCYNGQYLNNQNWTCVLSNQCQVGYFANSVNNTCTQCPTGCADCTSYNVCGNCFGGYTKTGNLCRNNFCTGNCLQCTGISNQCTFCNNGLYLLSQNWTCVQSNQCPVGYFANSFNNTCSQCPSGCADCTSSNFCGNCLGGYNKQGNLCTNNICNGNCATCNGISTQCTSCNNGLYLNYFNWTCVLSNQCPAGYYADPTSNTCLMCQGGCLSCSSATSCNNCNTALGYRYTGQGCTLCSSPCATCFSYSLFACTSCEGGLYLSGTTCSSTCPLGSYRAGNFQCSSCQSGCLNCADGNSCITCNTAAGYQNVIRNGVNVCASSADCFLPCKSCVAPYQATTCSSCDYGYNLQGTVCQTLCNAGFYSDVNRVCTPCSPTCIACIGTSTTCTSCPQNRNLSLSNCVEYCPLGEHSIGNICVKKNSSKISFILSIFAALIILFL